MAYRRQARAYHPDLSVDPDAVERFREVNEAYEVLAAGEAAILRLLHGTNALFGKHPRWISLLLVSPLSCD